MFTFLYCCCSQATASRMARKGPVARVSEGAAWPWRPCRLTHRRLPLALNNSQGGARAPSDVHPCGLTACYLILPASDCHDRPNGFDHSERPRALQESINRPEGAGPGERKHEPRTAILKRVANQHRGHGEQAEKRSAHPLGYLSSVVRRPDEQ
jgi:hypothetical protein